jgi:hypothetical protein
MFPSTAEGSKPILVATCLSTMFLCRIFARQVCRNIAFRAAIAHPVMTPAQHDQRQDRGPMDPAGTCLVILTCILDKS